MMPNVEVTAVLKDKKRRATFTIIYDDRGWRIHLVDFGMSGGSKSLANGKEKIGRAHV